MPPMQASTILHATPDQTELLLKSSDQVFLMHVALHELLGHGVGKQFYKNEDGSFNFAKDTFINPLTKKPVESWYGPGDTWHSKFGSISASYE